MIEIAKDKKSETWIITHTDGGGWHKQLNLTEEDMNTLVRLWQQRT